MHAESVIAAFGLFCFAVGIHFGTWMQQRMSRRRSQEWDAEFREWARLYGGGRKRAQHPPHHSEFLIGEGVLTPSRDDE